MMQRRGGVRWLPTVGVGQRHDSTEVEDNQSDHFGRKVVWAKYCCGEQTSCQNRMDCEREILGLKENC
jgi:hypothetical protein